MIQIKTMTKARIQMIMIQAANKTKKPLKRSPNNNKITKNKTPITKRDSKRMLRMLNNSQNKNTSKESKRN